jgi:hypothetical protein
MLVTNMLIIVGMPSFTIRLGTGCMVIISNCELYFFIADTLKIIPLLRLSYIPPEQASGRCLSFN